MKVHWTFNTKIYWLKSFFLRELYLFYSLLPAAAAAKSLQSCPTLCDPTDGSPLGSSVPGILQARILEWVAISFSNAWKWKVKVKSLSCAWLLATPWTAAHQTPLSMGFPGKGIGVGCHCLLQNWHNAICQLYLNKAGEGRLHGNSSMVQCCFSPFPQKESLLDTLKSFFISVTEKSQRLSKRILTSYNYSS